MHFNLAPLDTRRAIAMLGVIHRAVRREGPKHFHRFFQLATTIPRFVRHWHSKTLIDPCDAICPDYYRRSIFGLVGVYNLLPELVVAQESMKDFQSYLHLIVKYLAVSGYSNWSNVFHRDFITHSALLSITNEDLIGFELHGLAGNVNRLGARLRST